MAGHSYTPFPKENPKASLTSLKKSMMRSDREILDLKYADGFTIGELSQILSISASAVKMRLNRARIRTRKIALKESC